MVNEKLDEFALATEPQPREYESFIGRATYILFPVEVLPKPIRSKVVDGAAAIGCDESFVAFTILSGLPATVGNTRRILLKRGWTELAIVVWTAVTSEYNTRNAPAFRFALKPSGIANTA